MAGVVDVCDLGCNLRWMMPRLSVGVGMVMGIVNGCERFLSTNCYWGLVYN